MKTPLKLCFLILFMFCSVFNTYSQDDNNYLDEKNGFKNFTFGDLKSSYDNSLVHDKTALNFGGTYFYVFNDTEPSELFGIKWDNITLGFTREKLTDVKVKWRYNTIHFERIVKDLESVFGEAQISDTGYTLTYFWRSKNVLMKLTGKGSKYPKDYGDYKHFTLKIENIKLKSYLLYNKKKDF